MSARKTVRMKSADRRLIRKGRRGQAMVEYSVVSHFLLVGGGFVMMKVLPTFFEALTSYYESLFFVLSSGAV